MVIDTGPKGVFSTLQYLCFSDQMSGFTAVSLPLAVDLDFKIG